MHRLIGYKDGKRFLAWETPWGWMFSYMGQYRVNQMNVGTRTKAEAMFKRHGIEKVDEHEVSTLTPASEVAS